VSVTPHPATAEECDRIWPAAKSERLFESVEELRAYREGAPWRVRVTNRGEASVLGVWREHLDVLAMRGVWCAERHVAAFVADARVVACEQGQRRVMSPLLPVSVLGRYLAGGMRISQRIVAIQGMPDLVLPAGPPVGVGLRLGSEADIPALVDVDEACFDDFWRYGASELAEMRKHERLVVAHTDDGELIGYTLATVSRGAATLGRLGVAPSARRCGLARTLVADVAAWSVRAGASTLTLCTQEENSASRALYASMGLHEIEDRYAFAMVDACEEGRS